MLTDQTRYTACWLQNVSKKIWSLKTVTFTSTEALGDLIAEEEEDAITSAEETRALI